ncbi:VOC family protein [Actinokineospora fastidiosa]|uniref:Glyoxalase n=1 Tax=Actinokineospora fastidiosa TaxID=1816 RepID=A0A918GKI6_9PSEU|nr:VOC family protein [Actinokineospora fastidiosa]GGS39255.1 glyoxalase [Actinokineospora fastidiosa]
MSIELGGVTIDCANPRKLAEFWTAALDFEVGADYDGEFLFLTPRGTKLGELTAVALQRVDEPKSGKNRVHMDFHGEDRRAEVDRLVGLGATVLNEHTVEGMAWTVLADPEGNEFCVTADH